MHIIMVNHHALFPAVDANDNDTNSHHHVSGILSSISLDGLVAFEAAEGKVQLGVPVLVVIRARWPSTFLPRRRVAARCHKEISR